MIAELDVSSATLRRWSDEFADYLSSEAGSSQGRSHRRYSDEDLETLKLVKELRDSGLSYDQIRQQLDRQLDMWPAVPRPHDNGDDEDFGHEDERGLIMANGGESSAVAFFTNTLATLSDNQKSILNSQAANRELLGVLIQDNFNLKEENNRLRERILEVERTLVQLRQEDEWRRESLRQELDSKIMQVHKLASDAVTIASTPPEPPEIKAIKSKPGCLGALLGGGGDVQIVSMPRRRSRGKDEGTLLNQAGSAPAPASSQPARSAAHPKPMAPPE